jgi:hypothetical protein
MESDISYALSTVPNHAQVYTQEDRKRFEEQAKQLGLWERMKVLYGEDSVNESIRGSGPDEPLVTHT